MKLISEEKRIALVAHDNKKLDLLDWARFNRETLSRHLLYAYCQMNWISRSPASFRDLWEAISKSALPLPRVRWICSYSSGTPWSLSHMTLTSRPYCAWLCYTIFRLLATGLRLISLSPPHSWPRSTNAPPRTWKGTHQLVTRWINDYSPWQPERAGICKSSEIAGFRKIFLIDFFIILGNSWK
jgi:hypothetical protein